MVKTNELLTRTNIKTGQEVKTNEYIDGKPIYVKRIDFGALPNNANKDVLHGIISLDNIIKIEGTAISVSNYYYSIPNNNIFVFVSSTYVRLGTTKDESAYIASLNIYYTKN